MKKLIAIAVLFVSVTAAVLAQDDEGKWKVGFMARFVTDMLYATSVKNKFVYTPPAGNSLTEEFGNYNKGTVNFFGNSTNVPHADNRLLLSLTNSGENYDVYVDIAMDDWAQKWGRAEDPLTGYKMGIGQYLLTSTSADWGLTGTAGMFTGWVGNKFSPDTFTDPQGLWFDWIDTDHTASLFGVWRADGRDYNFDPSTPWGGGGFVVTSRIRTWKQWGEIAALAANFGDYRFTVGYRFNPAWTGWNPGGTAYDSKSSINASFMFSGRPVDGITFDLIYYVLGQDAYTLERPKGSYYASPTAYWGNTIGAYVGINLIENLGISLGYAVNFNAYETGGWMRSDEANRDVNYKAPIYSGIDLHLSYNGIDKVGLTFNNNFSFASVKGELNYDDYPNPGDPSKYYTSLVYGLGETYTLHDGEQEDWFHWDTALKASLGFIDGVGLTVALADKLGVQTYTYVRPDYVPMGTAGFQNKQVDVTLRNDFRVSVFAERGVGAVSIGAGLYFGVKSYLNNGEYTATDTTGTIKAVSSSDTVIFGVPIMFKVAF